MIKLNEEDTARLEELKIQVWSEVVNQKLYKNSNLDELTNNQIESHKGRIGKALRLLEESGYTCFSRNINIKKSYGSSSTQSVRMNQVNNLEESKSYGEEPKFIVTLPEMHDELFGCNPDDQLEMDTKAYREITVLSSKEKIYVYWNQEEFHFINQKIYPIALLNTRMKLILRSIVEQYFHSNFHSKIEEYLGVPTGSIKHEDHFDISIRNFAAHGHRFSMEKYFGENGFRNEYTHYRDYFEALIKSLDTFNSKIQKIGGHAVVVERYRKEIIETLLKKAPLQIFQKIKNNNSYDSITGMFENPFFNSFILRNSEYMVYDLLYDTDQTILYITNDGIHHRIDRYNSNVDTIFTPEQDELDIIKGTL